MKLSRIDIIGQNGNDGLHYDEGCVKYEEPDILDRLKATTKINGAYPKDIKDAIDKIEYQQELLVFLCEAVPDLEDLIATFDNSREYNDY